MAKHWTSTLAAVAAVPLLVSLLGACGTSDTAAKSPAPSTPASAGKKSFESFDEFQLAFAGCMREHGVAMADPSGGGVKLDAGGDMAAFEAASTACREQLGTPPSPEGAGTPKTDEELLADNLKIAKCLREHGVDVPDPKSGSSLEVPPNAPEDVMTTCAPNGVIGRTGGK